MTVTIDSLRGRRRAEGPARVLSRHARDRSNEHAESAVIAVEAITIIGLICAWMVSQMLLFGMLSHTRSQALLYGEFREQLAAATAPTGGVIVPGKPVSLVTIPAIGIQEVVVEGTSAGELLKGPGHMRSSVLPGQVGTSVVMGRARSYGAPFSNISLLRPGHAIHTTTAQGPATYRVDAVRRAGGPLPKDLGAGAGRLTLVSGYTGSRVDSLAPHEIVYVDATLISTAYEAPANAIRAVAASELAMARDTTILPSLALSMGGLAIALATVLLARERIRDEVIWIVGAPIVTASAWASGDGIMHLLPNLF
jgi:sortase A